MELRYKIFVIFALSLAAVFTLRMALLAGPAGERYRREAERIAEYQGELGAIRGRIYDVDGEIIAWSERCYDLVYRPGYTKADQAEAMQKALHADFPQAPSIRNFYRALPLKTNLTAAELEKADRLCEKYPGLHIKLRWERRIDADHAAMIGEVRQINGVEVGISGLEKKYDDLLRGTPGKFAVMLDRHGHWINSTFRIVKAAENGEDLELSSAEETHDASTP